MNRKLIRPNLAEVKGKEAERQRRPETEKNKPGNRTAEHQDQPMNSKKKTPPQVDTNAEIYYYRKQIEAGTDMVVVLIDGEKIEGKLEWYDRDAIKIVREDSPNLVILRHSIKYFYKLES